MFVSVEVLVLLLIVASVAGQRSDLQENVTNAGAEDLKYPENVVVEYGKSVKLMCRLSTNSADVKWAYWRPSDENGHETRVDLVRHCVVQPDVVERVSTETDKNGSCNLIVKRVRSSASGRYSCIHETRKELFRKAAVVTIESKPICTSNMVSGYIVEGSTIRFECRLVSHGPIRPLVEWTTVTDDKISPIDSEKTTDKADTFLSSIEIVAGKPFVPKIQALLRMGTPEMERNMAENDPAWEFVWTSPQTQITANPKGMQQNLWTDGYVGQPIRCSITIDPAAQYDWVDLDTSLTLSKGPVITLNDVKKRYLRCMIDFHINVNPAELINQAVMTGSEKVIFFCGISPSSASWQFREVATDDMVYNIVDACVVKDPKKYAVDKSYGGCNLVVLQASMEDGGTYVCLTKPMSEIDPQSAQLVVLGSEPECEGNAEKEIKFGDVIKMRCSIVYQGNDVYKPIMRWTDLVTGQSVKSDNKYVCNDLNCTLMSSVEIIASLCEVEMQCVTRIGNPESSLKMVLPLKYEILNATNVPVFETSWNSERYTPTCPVGFVRLPEQGFSCYQVILDKLSWDEAGNKCNSLNKLSHLAVIQSELEQVEIWNYVKTLDIEKCPSFWTSGQRVKLNDCSSPFVWKPFPGVTKHMTYTYWIPGEPNCQLDPDGTRESCMHLLSSFGGRWNDIHCETMGCPICQI